MTLKGYKHTELGVLPEDWEVVRLGDVCEIRDGTHESPKPTNEGKILITSKNLKGGKIDFLDSYHISLEDFEAINKRSKVEKYDILMSMIGTVGEVAFVDIEPNFAIKNVALFKMDGNEKFSKFLFFFFQSSIGKKRILSFLSGSTQKYITLDFLRNLKIPLPPLAEQEKIAEILSTWDTQIQNFETLITEKQALKKGLCQTLLTAKTRLKGFSEDWEVVRLGDVCEINPKSLELPDTFIYIDLESVSRGKLCSVKYMKKTNAPSRAKRTLQKHDILFQMVRPYQKNNLYFNLEGDYVASTGYAQIRTKQSSGFVFQYIHSRAFVDRVIEKCTGSNYPAINATDLSQIEIPLPSLAEQEKIAEILSEVDNGITLLEQKLESLKSQKKGIIQILLNGKVRVK